VENREEAGRGKIKKDFRKVGFEDRVIGRVLHYIGVESSGYILR
jgi:hypothetical protein